MREVDVDLRGTEGLMFKVSSGVDRWCYLCVGVRRRVGPGS